MSGATGGFSNGIVPRGQPYTFAQAVTKVGTIMYKTVTAAVADIAGSGNRPMGYAGETTTNVFGATDLTIKRNIMPLIPGDKVAFPLLATNQAIAVGDVIVLTTGGTVDKKGGAAYVMGVAEEAADVNAGAGTTPYLLVRVDMFYAAA